MEEKTEGLLLQSIPYLGGKRILKVFTQEGGLLTLIAKKKSLAPLTIPFCKAEWVYKKGKEEIHLLQDGTVLDDLFELKQSYDVLEGAGQMARDLLRTQFPGKKGGDLYTLVLAYLKQLPQFALPKILNISFRLKILLHEGLLFLDSSCAKCEAPALHLSAGESVCQQHTHHPNIPFHPDEWELLHILGKGRKFSLMKAICKTSRIEEKVNVLFEERLRS